jgi:hypothetical protein
MVTRKFVLFFRDFKWEVDYVLKKITIILYIMFLYANSLPQLIYVFVTKNKILSWPKTMIL